MESFANRYEIDDALLLARSEVERAIVAMVLDIASARLFFPFVPAGG